MSGILSSALFGGGLCTGDGSMGETFSAGGACSVEDACIGGGRGVGGIVEGSADG